MILVMVFAIVVMVVFAAFAGRSTKTPATHMPQSPVREPRFRWEPMRGEYWQILSSASIMRAPEAPGNERQYLRNLVMPVGPGDFVEILEMKGFIDVWAKVYLYRGVQDPRMQGKPLVKGWICVSTVDKAKRLPSRFR